MPAPGSAPQRMLAYTGAWAERRGVRITTNGLALAMGSPLRRKLERRLLAKAGKSTLALAPLLAGAAAGAVIDHRETRRLGTLVREDLRKRSRDIAAS
jgi:siroheme synthase (precorrin-2 oxidase/ferrochelatase)